MKVLQINTVVNSGSTGRIAEDIGLASIANGYHSYIAAAYTSRPSASEVIKIGNELDRKFHGLKTRLFDRHGFGSTKATLSLVQNIKEIEPDIIHLHNIHGYYLHIGILFEYLKKAQLPVVWTFHDCWPFTGHCSHFDRYGCYKWKTQCFHCPNKKGYPASYGLDQSRRNYNDKKILFNGIRNLQIVTPSEWLVEHVRHSFLHQYPVQMIHNGIDLNDFKPQNKIPRIKQKWNLAEKKIILGVASTWKKRRALEDFIELSKILKPDEQIILVGLTEKMTKDLPANIIGIERTESIAELAELYSAAEVFINPTYIDNFPTTNIEALACGTPVITYNTGGSPEAIDSETGIVVEKGNINELYNGISTVLRNGQEHYSSNCRKRAEDMFDKKDRYGDYLKLYEEMMRN